MLGLKSSDVLDDDDQHEHRDDKDFDPSDYWGQTCLIISVSLAMNV